MSSNVVNTLELRDIDLGARLSVEHLAFAAGAVTVVVGSNGAGKSTLLDLAAGVLRPRAGRVFLHGDDVHAWSPRDRARRIASLGAREPLLDELTVRARIAQGLIPRRGAGAFVDERGAEAIDAIAQLLDLTQLLDLPLGRLSTGQRKRAHVARALVDDRAVAVILDEPFASLDLAQGRALASVLRAVARAGRIVVVSVHELGVAALCGDHIIGLRAGRVVVDGPLPRALDDAAVQALYGDARVRLVLVDGGVGVVFLPGDAIGA